MTTAPINTVQKELLDSKREVTREILIKTLLSLIGIIVGIVTTIFLNVAFLPWGVGLTILSSLSFYHYLRQYRHTCNAFDRAIEAVKARRIEITL